MLTNQTLNIVCFKVDFLDRVYKTHQQGGGYFASLRARASSREPQASVCEPQKIPAKKSKNGHNALIWHLLAAGYFIYANTRGTFYRTEPTKGNRIHNFNSFSEFLTQEKQGSEPVCQKRKGKFR